jgi:hypothetical protein
MNTAALHNRLKRLKRKMDARRPALPMLNLTQSWDDPDIFTGNDGATYARSQLADLETRYSLLLIVYGDWPPGDDLGAVV